MIWAFNHFCTRLRPTLTVNHEPINPSLTKRCQQFWIFLAWIDLIFLRTKSFRYTFFEDSIERRATLQWKSLWSMLFRRLAWIHPSGWIQARPDVGASGRCPKALPRWSWMHVAATVWSPAQGLLWCLAVRGELGAVSQHHTLLLVLMSILNILNQSKPSYAINRHIDIHIHIPYTNQYVI